MIPTILYWPSDPNDTSHKLHIMDSHHFWKHFLNFDISNFLVFVVDFPQASYLINLSFIV